MGNITNNIQYGALENTSCQTNFISFFDDISLLEKWNCVVTVDL